MAQRDHSQVARFEINDDPRDTPYRQKKKIQNADKNLQVAVGAELKVIATWLGQRHRAGDELSIDLFKQYIEMLVGNLDDKKVALLVSVEEVKGGSGI